MANSAPSLVPVGPAGGEELRNMLCRSKPRPAILQWKKVHGLAVEATNPALDLLHALNLCRYSAHKSLLEVMRTKLLERIRKMDPAGLPALLNASFPYISIPDLREIPVAVMLRLDKISHRFLDTMSKDAHLMNYIPTGLRRQCYERIPNAFQEQITQAIDAYVARAAATNLTLELRPSVSRKRKLKTDDLDALVNCICGSPHLYGQVLEYIRTRYASTGNIHLCTLRLELCEQLHEVGPPEVVLADGADRIVKLLCACTTGAEMNAKWTTEFLSATSEITDPVVHGERVGEYFLFLIPSPTTGDFAMMCKAPTLLLGLQQHTLVGLRRVLDLQGDPSGDRQLVCVIQLLTMALGVGDGRLVKPERELVKTMLPLLVIYLANDALIAAEEPIVNGVEMPDALLHCLSTCSISQHLFFCYMLDRVESPDTVKVLQLVQVLSSAISTKRVDLRDAPAFIDSLTSAVIENEVLHTPDTMEQILQFFESLVRASAACNAAVIRLVTAMSISSMSLTPDRIATAVSKASYAAVDRSSTWSKEHRLMAGQVYTDSVKTLLENGLEEIVNTSGINGAVAALSG